MFKNAILVRAAGRLDVLALIEGASAVRFSPCGPTQARSIGFVPPRGKHEALAESIGGQWILAVRMQTKSVPAAEVKKQLDARADKIEELTGRKPGKKQRRELKEEVVLELLPKAFPKEVTVPVWIDPADGLVVIGTASWARADELTTLLAQILPDVRLSVLSTAQAADGCMAAWLVEKEAPSPFALDRECELKQPDGEKAVVRYSRHTLDIDEVGEHIKQGKRPTKVAITHAGRVSFVLTDDLVLRKIDVLDSALEGASKEEYADAFDADFAIETGELRHLIDDLISALGGETDALVAVQE